MSTELITRTDVSTNEYRAPKTTARFDSPLGACILTLEDGELVAVDFPGRLLDDETGSEAGAVAGSAPYQDRLAWWIESLEDYFEGKRLAWTEEEAGVARLPVTEFRKNVYRALLQVPPGETIGYGELARAAGRPGAARAVGSAMAQNPIPIVIPCHRVVRADGSLGNYGGGQEWKAFLLKHEAKHAKPKRS